MNILKFLLSVFIMLFLFSEKNQAFENSNQIQPLKWEVGFNKTKEIEPIYWFPAVVPGAVQLDYAKANHWPVLWYAENWKEYGWMEDVYWTYKTTFKKPAVGEGEQLFFVSKGIDYEFEITLNGERLFYQEGMFTPVNLNFTDKLKAENELLIKILPAPKIGSFRVDRSQAAQSCKPAVSYGWDWHPRLVPLGIWDDTFLEIRKNTHITDLFTNYKLNPDFSEAAITVFAEGENLKGNQFEWSLLSREGKKVCSEKGEIQSGKITVSTLKNPELWWPHDHGAQPLYFSELTIKDKTGKVVASQKQTVGFRQVRLVRK